MIQKDWETYVQSTEKLKENFIQKLDMTKYYNLTLNLHNSDKVSEEFQCDQDKSDNIISI